jgi:hypothetical protein
VHKPGSENPKQKVPLLLDTVIQNPKWVVVGSETSQKKREPDFQVQNFILSRILPCHNFGKTALPPPCVWHADTKNIKEEKQTQGYYLSY